jgi:hypothetical protein
MRGTALQAATCCRGNTSLPPVFTLRRPACAPVLLQVAGSRSADVSTKGQRADHKIVRRSLLPLLPNGPAAVAWAGSGCIRLLS